MGPIDRRMNHNGQSRDMVKHARREARVRTVRLRPSLVVRHSTVLVVDTVLLISSTMRKLRIFEWLSMQVLKEFF